MFVGQGLHTEFILLSRDRVYLIVSHGDSMLYCVSCNFWIVILTFAIVWTFLVCCRNCGTLSWSSEMYTQNLLQ